MSDDQIIKDLVRQLIAEEVDRNGDQSTTPALRQPPAEDLVLARKAARWLGAAVPTPPMLSDWRPQGTRSDYLLSTPARLGVGRAGLRYRTDTALSFLADHAAARDAVASDIDPGIVEPLGFVRLRSVAADKREFLLRPDLGRQLSPESMVAVKRQGSRAPQIQIVAADGLSATAINVNLPLVYPALTQALADFGFRVGVPFAISNGRVAAADEVARLTGAEVLCLLVGERPGLRTAESMGAYITYMRVRQFNEAMRWVISNIHKNGLKPEEAALQVADSCRKAMKEKRSGVDVLS